MTLKGIGSHDQLKNTGSRRCSNPDIDDVSVSTDDEVETVTSQLCCLQGCLATSAVGFAFFVGLPSGILLVFYASKNYDATLLTVGGLLIALPVLTLLAFVGICLYKQRLKRLSKTKVGSTTDIAKQASGHNVRY